MAPIRTFIAFTPPSNVREEIFHFLEKLNTSKADVKWETIDKLHVTMTFLGNVDEANLRNVIAHIKNCCASSRTFPVTYSKLGTFPHKKHPKVVWLGCEEPTGTLYSLKQQIDRALAPLGFTPEDRRFHPHITFGRVRGEKGIVNLLSIMENLIIEPRTATVEKILVMKSELHREGAAYSIIESIQLPIA